MAKYNVDHACGHSETHVLYGPHKERDRKLAWLEGTDCSECYRAKKEAGREAANAAAAERNQASGLPALTGSEKQVAWAESIRGPICAALAEYEADLATSDAFHPGLSDAAREELGDAVVLVVDEIRGQASARWWIDEGRDLNFAQPDPGRRKAYTALHVHEQILKRGLAPTAAREAAEIEARLRAEAEAGRRLAEELATTFPADGLAWDEAAGTVSGAIAGHAVAYSRDRQRVTIDGVEVADAGDLRRKLADVAWRAAEGRRAAERLARCDALAGAAVASVAKKKQDLTVTLADGRVLTGVSDRAGWALTAEREGPYTRHALDAGHPEVARLAAEARAWAKTNGVK